MARKKPMLTIPVLDVQKQLDDDYRDQIEMLNLKIMDQDDANQFLKDRITRLEERDKDSQTRIESYQAAVVERSYAVARVTSLESDVRKLTADLKTEISNRDHFRSLVAQQDAFIKEAKHQIEEFKAKKEAELKSKTSEAEHLAKQTLRLNEENSKLRTDNVELTSRSNQLNTQTPLLMEENQKFREQTARLIEEKRKLDEQVKSYECWGCRSGEHGAYCGGCLGCLMRQAEHNMNETDKALRIERSIVSYKDSIIATLSKGLDTLKAMPCITWRQQGVAYRNCKSTVAALDGNIDNIREHKIVPRGSRLAPPGFLSVVVASTKDKGTNMPFLSQADRDASAHERKCNKCNQTINNSYCSRCDEFYEVGHKKGCPFEPDAEDRHDSTTCGGDRGYR